MCVTVHAVDMVFQKWGARIYLVSPPRHTQRAEVLREAECYLVALRRQRPAVVTPI